MMTIQEIQKIINDITGRYKSIGKKTTPVICLAAESSGLNGFSGGDCVPFGTSKDGTKMFVDLDVLTDLTKESAYIYIPHELAHCFTKENHEGENFQFYIEDYNDYFTPKTVADPDDSLNIKYLPVFHRKDEMYSKVKSNEEWEKMLKTKPWRKRSAITESYFPY